MLREARVWGRSWRTVGNWLPHPPTPTLLSSWTTCPCSGKQVNRWRQVISCDNWWYLGDITRHLASEGYYMWHLWHQMNWFGERWKKSSTVVTRLLVPFGPVFSAQWTKSFCVPKNTYWEKVVVLARTRQVNVDHVFNFSLTDYFLVKGPLIVHFRECSMFNIVEIMQTNVFGDFPAPEKILPVDL